MPWPGQTQETPAKPRIALIMGNAAYSSGIGTLANMYAVFFHWY